MNNCKAQMPASQWNDVQNEENKRKRTTQKSYQGVKLCFKHRLLADDAQYKSNHLRLWFVLFKHFWYKWHLKGIMVHLKPAPVELCKQLDALSTSWMYWKTWSWVYIPTAGILAEIYPARMIHWLCVVISSGCSVFSRIDLGVPNLTKINNRAILCCYYL